MTSLDSPRLNYGGNDTVAEIGNNRSVSRTTDGLALAAEPTYDREYNHLLTLEEATR